MALREEGADLAAGGGAGRRDEHCAVGDVLIDVRALEVFLEALVVRQYVDRHDLDAVRLEALTVLLRHEIVGVGRVSRLRLTGRHMLGHLALTVD